MKCNSQGVLSLNQLDSDLLHQYLAQNHTSWTHLSDVFSTFDCKIYFTNNSRLNCILSYFELENSSN